MIVSVVLSLMLAAAPPAAAPANNGMEVTLPEFQTAPAPNIHLEHFEYTTPSDGHANIVDYDQMMRLQEGVKAAARATLAHSQSRFGVRLIYALTPDKPAQVRMQVAAAPPVESPRVKQFYVRASALKAFHCKSGTVYVLFDYRVSPAVSGRRAKDASIK